MESEAGRHEAARSRPTRADLLCLALLGLVCLILRVPSLDRIALNPDESQYTSSAAYLAANGASAYAFPYGEPWTMTLYKGLTLLFGPYPMFEARILVLLIALGTSWILYDWVQRVAGRAWGLVAGLLFLHVNQAFEGWSANREWFSFFPALVGIYLATLAAQRPGRPRIGLWLLAGFICGMTLWFKRQAVFLTLVVPTLLIWLAWVESAWRPRLRQLLPFAAGGLAAGALFVLPFLLHGTLQVYVGSLFADYSLFVAENEKQTQTLAGGAAGLYAAKLFVNLPHRALFLVAYLFAAAVLVGALLRGLGRRARWSGADRPDVVAFALYLVAALGCVQLGNRFFGHYYLFAVAPLVGCFALAGCRWGRPDDDRITRGLALATAGLFVIDRAFGLSINSLAVYRAAWPASAPYFLYALVGLVIVGVGLIRPWRRAGALLVALLLLETAMVVVQEQRRAVPPSFRFHPDAFAELADKVHADAGPHDRIFVWGWIPEIYSATRLEPATHMTITEYIVEDYYVIPRGPTINRPLAELLMDDLRRHRPRFIVDATRRSWTMVAGGDPWLYRLDQYPEFELVRMLREEYRHVGRYSDCELYERRPEPMPDGTGRPTVTR